MGTVRGQRRRGAVAPSGALLSAPEKPTADLGTFWLVMFAAAVAHTGLVAVVAEHAWTRWAVAAELPPLTWSAFAAGLLLWAAVRRNSSRVEDDPDKVFVALLGRYLLLALAAAVVWWAP